MPATMQRFCFNITFLPIRVPYPSPSTPQVNPFYSPLMSITPHSFTFCLTHTPNHVKQKRPAKMGSSLVFILHFFLYPYRVLNPPKVNPFHSLLMSTSPHPSTCCLKRLTRTPNHIKCHLVSCTTRYTNRHQTLHLQNMVQWSRCLQLFSTRRTKQNLKWIVGTLLQV